MKMPSLRIIIFVLVIIIFVGLFYSIVKPYHIFGDANIEGATGQNPFDDMYNTNMPNFCTDITSFVNNNTTSSQRETFNTDFKNMLITITSSNVFNNFNIRTNPMGHCFNTYFRMVNDSNKKLISTIIDKIIDILNDIKSTYLQRPNNMSTTSTLQPQVRSGSRV